MNRARLLILAGPLAAATLFVACGDGPDPIPTPTTRPSSPTVTTPGTTATTSATAVVGMSQTEFNELTGIQESSTGIRYVDEVEGTGPSPDPQGQVTIHYTGTLASNGTQFDTSKDGQPLTLGTSQFIKGFTEALLTMKEGGTRIVYIPADLGYADQARPGIPANSDLIFEIELLSAQ